MSGPSSTTAAPASGGADPSMEDILASIRRILSEDEAEAPAAPAPPASHPVAEAGRAADVLALDTSMLVQPPQAEPPPPAPMAPPPAPEPHMPEEPQIIPSPSALLGAEASAAAASSLSSLLRTLSAERQPVAVYRNGGPSIEDMVRDELRPLLKHWLDHNLPGMVERLVRAEIERVVGRT